MLLRSGYKADMSPPNGMLPVNVIYACVYWSQHVGNQQLACLPIESIFDAFTRVNEHVPQSARCVNSLTDNGLPHPALDGRNRRVQAIFEAGSL